MCVMRICIIREYKKYFSHAHVYASLSESSFFETIFSACSDWSKIHLPDWGKPAESRSKDYAEKSAIHSVKVAGDHARTASQTTRPHKRRPEQAATRHKSEQRNSLASLPDFQTVRPDTASAFQTIRTGTGTGSANDQTRPAEEQKNGKPIPDGTGNGTRPYQSIKRHQTSKNGFKIVFDTSSI